MGRIRFGWLVILAMGAGPAAAQAARDHGTITIVIGAEPTLPIPTLSSFKQNIDVASLLFLPLARPGADLRVNDESNFEPALARRWTHPDSLTIVFELDPRARWHDGVPVTSRDVVWSLERARDPAIAPTHALLLRQIESVTADGPHRVIVRFRRAYPEQLYDAVFHVPPLPAHLLDSIPAGRLATSAYVRHPVGNGPYRWGHTEPGRQLELVAVPDFFLGAPKLDRVVFLLARSAEAQLNLVLDGTADAYESVFIARNVAPVVGRPGLAIRTYPSLTAGFLLFNQRVGGDSTKPHPILADAAVRRALAMGIDRRRLLRSVFGAYASLTEGPMGQAHWIRRVAPKGPAYAPDQAAALLASRGWNDSDGDGIRDRNGSPLRLRLAYPGTSVPRVALAEPIQEMLRQIGVRIDLVRLDGPIWYERRKAGDFDIDLSQIGFDPSPSGLVQSWTCAGIGGSNVGSICDPAFDRALDAAIASRGSAARGAWRRAIAALQAGTPAVFLYSPAQVVVLHARYRNVSFRPEAPWADLWRWSVNPSQRLARDDPPGR